MLIFVRFGWAAFFSALLVALLGVESAVAGGGKQGFHFGGGHRSFCLISPDIRTVELRSLEPGTESVVKVKVRCNVRFELTVEPGLTGVLENQRFTDSVEGFAREVPYKLSFSPFGPGRSDWYKGPLFVKMKIIEYSKPLLAGKYQGLVVIGVDADV